MSKTTVAILVFFGFAAPGAGCGGYTGASAEAPMQFTPQLEAK